MSSKKVAAAVKAVAKAAYDAMETQFSQDRLTLQEYKAALSDVRESINDDIDLRLECVTADLQREEGE